MKNAKNKLFPERINIPQYLVIIGGGRVVQWCWVNFQCRGILLIWIRVGQGPTALAVGAGGGCLDIFALVCHFSFLSPSLWETAWYRLKYCLKGPLSPRGWLEIAVVNEPSVRAFETVFQSISGRLPKRGRKSKERIDESKNVHTTPTRTHCKCNRPLPYCNPDCRTPRHWKFTQHHRTTRPPPSR